MKSTLAEWEVVAESWSHTSRQQLWRSHSAQLHKSVMNRWLSGARGTRVLKTDLFEEFLGHGIVTELSPAYRQLFAMDLSHRIVAGARRCEQSLYATQADLRALPFADASFDGVLSTSSLDHFDNFEDLRISAQGHAARRSSLVDYG